MNPYGLLIGAITLNIAANFFMKKMHIIDTGYWQVLIYALVSLGASFVCYSLSLKYITVSTGYMLLTGGSLIGITLMSTILLGETLSLRLGLGLLIIVIGLVVVSTGGVKG